MFVVYLFVFVVDRTDPQSSPASQSTGGVATHHHHLPTKDKGKPAYRTTTKAKKLTSYHHHHHRTRPKVKMGMGISVAYCSLCKCYLGGDPYPKNSIERKLGAQQFANLPLFCGLSMVDPSLFFYPTSPPDPYLPSSQTKKMYFF